MVQTMRLLPPVMEDNLGDQHMLETQIKTARWANCISRFERKLGAQEIPDMGHNKQCVSAQGPK